MGGAKVNGEDVGGAKVDGRMWESKIGWDVVGVGCVPRYFPDVHISYVLPPPQAGLFVI